jgi:hypothetical protein
VGLDCVRNFPITVSGTIDEVCNCKRIVSEFGRFFIWKRTFH